MIRLILEAVKEWVESLLYDTFGLVPSFDTMPSNDRLAIMPNGTKFRTKGFYTIGDGAGGYYEISGDTQSGALQITDNKYLIAIYSENTINNVINVERYGIRPTKADLRNISSDTTGLYASENSSILSKIITPKPNTVFQFGYGKFVFSEPIDLVQNYSIVGSCTPIDKEPVDWDKNYGTVLCFPFLTDGQSAISIGQGNIENIIVLGNYNTYYINFDRTKTITAPSEVVVESIATNNGNEVKCTGIHKSNKGYIQNVAVYGFYTGCYCDTANIYINTFYACRCHFGLSVFRDTKSIGVYGFNVHTMATIRGSVSSIIQLRVDSCVHAVNVYSGYCVNLVDIDGDYCTDSLITIGNPNGNTGGLFNASFTGIHGRSSTLKAYEKSQNGIDISTLGRDTIGYGVIRVLDNTNVYDSYFELNNIGGRDPFDAGANTYECPHVAFTFGANVNAKKLTGNVFSVPSNDIATKEDILKVFQTFNGMTARIDSNSGTYYINGTNVEADLTENELSSDIDFTTLLGGDN